jgi:hypothetical protein
VRLAYYGGRISHTAGDMLRTSLWFRVMLSSNKKRGSIMVTEREAGFDCGGNQDNKKTSQKR